MDSELTLKSKDGIELKITKKNAQLSTLLNEANQTTFEIKDVDGKTLQLIVNFLNHYEGTAPKEIDKPIKSSNLKEILDEWSFDFLEHLSVDEVSNLTVGSNYMEIQSLLDIVCARIAVMCKDKSDEEIITMFNIKEVFSENEKAKIREENKWIEDSL